MAKIVQDVGDIPDGFMLCRAFRKHDDKHMNDTVTTKRGVVIEFTRNIRCSRCGFESWTTYSVPSFEVVRRKTHYEDGYLIKGGLKGPDAKSEYLQRLGYKVGRREVS